MLSFFPRGPLDATRQVSQYSGDLVPYTNAFSLGVDHTFAGDFAVSAMYVRRRSRDLLTRRIVNLFDVPPGDPNFGKTTDGGPQISEVTYDGLVNYDGIILSARKRFSDRYQFGVSYTGSRARDNLLTGTVGSTFANNNHPEYDYGPSNQSAPHIFVANGVAVLPFDIDVSGIAFWRSGTAFNPRGLIDSDGDGLVDQRDLTTAAQRVPHQAVRGHRHARREEDRLRPPHGERARRGVQPVQPRQRRDGLERVGAAVRHARDLPERPRDPVRAPVRVRAMTPSVADRVVAEVDRAVDEIVQFTADLVRIPTVNPPGEAYEECARFLGNRLSRSNFDVEYFVAEGRPEHTARHPRVNVVGSRRAGPEPVVHLNGHVDVVPAGDGWTVDPFGGLVRDGRIYGRGVCDMKAGIAAAMFAAEAIARAGVALPGTIEISGTVDEESGGFAGVAWLAEQKRIAKGRTDFVIIPEPLNVDRICIGHRGVYWFEVTTRGRIAHGSMPFLGVSAIDGMGRVLEAVRAELAPALAARTTAVPVVPPGARHATINVNGVAGGQPVDGIQTPCVADRCHAVFDRRFLLEEGFDACKQEIAGLVERAVRTLPGARVRPARPDDRPSRGHARRLAARVRPRPRDPPRARPPGHASWPARAPTITSTSRASPACRTASRTVRASSSWRTSRTSRAGLTTWRTPPRSSRWRHST